MLSGGSWFFTVYRGVVVSGMEKAHLTSTDLAIRLISWLNPSINGISAVSNLSPSAAPCDFPVLSILDHPLVFGLLDKISGYRF